MPADSRIPSSDFPLVSVVVPVWNASRFLREALESVRSQTYTRIEVILVDDGSSDDSPSICREFCRADSRFHLFSQENSGVSAARNFGIDRAAGKWITFMDADDEMMPDCIGTLLAASYVSRSKIIVGDFSRKRPVYDPDVKEARFTVIDSDMAIIYGLYQKYRINNPWGVLFDKSVFKGNASLHFCSGRYEDLDLFYRAFDRVDKICLVDKVVYYYRDTPGSFINNWSDSRLDVLDVTDRMVEYFRGRDPRLLRAAHDRRFSAHFNMLLEMTRHGIADRKQKERCLQVIKERRWHELTDRNVRLKNKLGALLSYFFLW